MIFRRHSFARASQSVESGHFRRMFGLGKRDMTALASSCGLKTSAVFTSHADTVPERKLPPGP